MQIRPRLEAVIDDMLDGRILLSEALDEFEKLYIQKAYTRNRKRISHTAAALGIHRNTISKRVNSYRAQERKYQSNGTRRINRKTTSATTNGAGNSGRKRGIAASANVLSAPQARAPKTP